MAAHVMCLTSSGGIPIFLRKRGEGNIVSFVYIKYFIILLLAFYNNCKYLYFLDDFFKNGIIKRNSYVFKITRY